jgi:hypothetical protein
MLATVSPDAGKTMIAQTLEAQQSDNNANVVEAGFRLRGIPLPFPPMPPVPPPPIPMPEIPDYWMKAAGAILQLLRRSVGIGGSGGDECGCSKERREAREICTEAYANGWKSDYNVGPYKTPWTIDDCMRGLISERCGGNAVDK